MNVHSWAASDIGRKRQINEDSFLVDPELGLYVVADGMGGHAAGEVASARCVEIVRETVHADRQTLEAFAKNPAGEARDAVQKLLTIAIQRACKEIFQLAERDKAKRGMGTTCVALLVCGSKGVVAHAGDSRAYLMRHGRVHQLTEDHSLVEEHVKRGLMTREQAENSDIRNVITRAVGIQSSVEVDTLLTDVTPGDMFLLCSDGLHGYLKSEAELASQLSFEPRSLLPQRLVDVANQRGGKDNITAVVVSAASAVAGGDEGTDIDAKAEILRRIPLFQFMTYKELLAILSISKGCSFAPGEVVMQEGSAGEDMLVIFRGKLEVLKGGAVVATLGPGGHVGEMGLVDQAPRSATVVAKEKASAISLGRDTLLKLMRKDSLLAVKLLWSFVQVLSDRLRNTTAALSGLQDEVERLRGETEIDIEVLPPPPPFGDE